MKPDSTENTYPTDDCMMENFSENYQLCQLIRDESFGWPLQDPDLDADPFNTPSHQALDFDLSVFDSSEQREGSMEWNQPAWPAKAEHAPIPESPWQLAININSSSDTCSDSTSLTPCLAALDFPKLPCLPSDDYALGASRPRESFPLKSDYSQKCYSEFPKQWEYHQGGDLGRGMYVVQQPAGPGDVVTIGIYTRAERAAKIHRFRQKRERRNFSKRVLYGSRKRFADSRPRVGGRFVVNENRVVKPKTFLKRGRPRKVPMLPMLNCLASSLLLN